MDLAKERFASALAETLESWWCGVALVDENAVVIHASARGRQVLSSSSLRSDRAGRLTAASAIDSTRLGKAIREVTRPPASDGSQRWSGFVGSDGLIVVLAGVGASTRIEIDESRCALAFFFHLADMTISSELVSKVFGLTSRQSRVAELVACGYGPGQIARALGRDYETARSHLRELREKTGTRRLSELVRTLILTGSLAGRRVRPSPKG
jgi:DNA-binding CsgD family transcriptional regulator